MAPTYDGDPLEQQFDRGVGFAAYGLLVISSFFLGVPGIVAAAIAYAHKRGTSRVLETHFRFQLRIFWTCVALFGLGLLVFTAASVLGLTEMMRYAPFNLEGFRRGLGLTATQGASLAMAMVIGGLVLVAASGVWSIAGAIYGLIKLIGDRPVGRLPV